MTTKKALIILLCIFFVLIFIVIIIFNIKVSPYTGDTSPAERGEWQPARQLATGMAGGDPYKGNREKAKAAFVYDGDTIELSDGRKVRYIGINTPEEENKSGVSQCYSRQASDINKQLVAGQEVEMEKDISDTDKYGRLLRYIWVDGVFINDFLVRQGYAKAETIPPDTKYSGEFTAAEKEAKEDKRGLWKECYRE